MFYKRLSEMTISNYPVWTPTIRKTNHNPLRLRQKTLDVIFQIDYLADSISYLYNDDVHPSQCDTSTLTINDTVDKVGRLCGYVEKTNISDVANRYEIVVLLSYLEEQLEKLYSLITDLRPICRENTKRNGKLQKEIIRQFEEILETRENLKSINHWQ